MSCLMSQPAPSAARNWWGGNSHWAFTLACWPRDQCLPCHSALNLVVWFCFPPSRLQDVLDGSHVPAVESTGRESELSASWQHQGHTGISVHFHLELGHMEPLQVPWTQTKLFPSMTLSIWFLSFPKAFSDLSGLGLVPAVVFLCALMYVQQSFQHLTFCQVLLCSFFSSVTARGQNCVCWRDGWMMPCLCGFCPQHFTFSSLPAETYLGQVTKMGVWIQLPVASAVASLCLLCLSPCIALWLSGLESLGLKSSWNRDLVLTRL